MKIALLPMFTLGLFACNHSTSNKTVENAITKDSLVEVESVYIDNNELDNELKGQINPTGTYKLDSKTEEKDGEVYGYSGKIKVKAIAKDKIVITLCVCKGAPSYNLGSIRDTLKYIDNIAVYTAPDDIDATCKITFQFKKNGLSVKEETADYNSGCGFGHAVVADGFYKRSSSKTPIITEPCTD